MLPERDFENRFFSDAPRRVLARLLKQGPSVTRLLEWMADPAKIDERLYGTPQTAYVDPKAGPQRAGVLASLNMIADSLDLLPKKSKDRESFVTGKWSSSVPDGCSLPQSRPCGSASGPFIRHGSTC